jgi:hypothetical protein
MDSVESALRAGLVSGDATAESIVPILRHVLTSEDSSLFGDEIVARVRGMLNDLAGQLLDRQDLFGGDGAPVNDNSAAIGILGDVLLDSAALLGHLHALALEWQLTQRLEARFGVDPVLTPLLQALISSNNPQTAGLAMHLLAAQARHGQTQRRMALPLLELPAELLHLALTALRTTADRLGPAGDRVEAVQSRVRRDYDEATTRLGLAAQLVSSLGPDARDALSIRHAGTAIFVSALAIGADIDRDQAVLSTHESQAARFALALRASGVKGRAVLDQCLTLHPDLSFPDSLEEVSPDRAAALLAAGGAHFGD